MEYEETRPDDENEFAASFTLLGLDEEGSSVAYAIFAQSEVMLHDEEGKP